MSATPEGRTPTGTQTVGDGALLDVDRKPESPERRDLPPAKGDSDLRGQTPDDMETPPDALLAVRGLKQYFPIRKGFFNRVVGHVKAVDGVSFFVKRGETLGLVGESGCGKSTTGKTILRLQEATEGRAEFEGRNIFEMGKDELRTMRRKAQIVFQDPYSSLNPVHTIGEALMAPLLRHRLARGRRGARDRAAELLHLVDLTPPENFLGKHPHQLSGGQRQRVSIARALTLNPRVIIADEAVSMVDVSIRVSLLNTLLKLRNDLGVTFLFITHDLAVVKYFGWEGRVGVMYVGKMVEYGRTPHLIGRSMHPYTRALAAAIPEADPDLTRSKRKIHLHSLDIPNLTNLPGGCVFHPRCPLAIEACRAGVPPLEELRPNHFVACIRAKEQLGRNVQ